MLLAGPLLGLDGVAQADEPEPYLVKDICIGADNSIPEELTAVDGTLFFRAYDGVHGNELWKSNGTEEGTSLVKDIHTGDLGSYPQFLTNLNGTLFFRANDGIHGSELWKSDGTEAGTRLVKDIRPGDLGSSPFYLTNLNGTLYFGAEDGTHGYELWKSDGTEAGTVLVRDIRPGSEGSGPTWLAGMSGTLFFEAWDGTHGGELWKSDGTEIGTVMVKDISPGSKGWGVEHLTAVNGTLFFALGGMEGGTVGLWKSDGTEEGTMALSGGVFQGQLTNVNGTLFFRNRTSAHGDELWKSDGTEEGTVLVKDIYPGSEYSSPYDLTAIDDILYFDANDGSHGSELWTSDGTETGTVMVKDLNPGTGGSGPRDPTAANGAFFLGANDGTHGCELWESDGTEAGTAMVSDLYPGSVGSLCSDWFETELAMVGARLFFGADDGIRGRELWALSVEPCSTPSATTLSSPSDGSSTCDDKPTFGWGTVDGAERYRIQVDDDADFSSPAFTKQTSETDYTPDAGLSPGTYYWRVRAINDCDRGPWSSKWQLVILSAPPKPELSAPADGGSTCESKPAFDWSSVSGATTYRIQVDDDESFASPVIDEQISRSRYTPGADLSQGTFHWRVQALNDCGDSGWTSASQFSIGMTLEKPALASPADGGDICQPRLTFDWSSVDGATSYRIQVDDDESFASPRIDEQTSKSSHKPVEDLSLGTYFWRVGAASDCGDSGWTPVRTFTLLAVPAAPALSKPADGSSTCEALPAFAWSAVPGTTSYGFQVAAETTYATLLISDTLATASYTGTVPLPLGTYFWHVRSSNECGPGAWSGDWRFGCQACLYLPLVLREQ
jgi:ELWxxDGT repeat protein